MLERDDALHRTMKPVALFVADNREYLPANRIAVALAGVAGMLRIPEDRLEHIRALGFEVAFTNGQPIPHPRRVDVVV